MTDTDLDIFVTTVFREAGLNPTAPELAAFVAAYPGMRTFLDSLYTLPGVRYESPALTFDPRKAYRDA